MRLAKPHLDIGLFTNDIAPQRRFWSETAGLRLDHELAVGPGWVQHRYDAHGSVIKVNLRDDPLPDLPPSGYVGLTIARAGAPAWAGHHPGGDAACAQIVARGGTLGRAPVTLGEVARYGFVCDPDGNWIEISARASLTEIVPRPD